MERDAGGGGKYRKLRGRKNAGKVQKKKQGEGTNLRLIKSVKVK